MSILLRPAVQSDIPYLYKICLETGDNGKDSTNFFYDPWLVGQFYAAPYLFYNISFCFIAEEDNTPKGYCLGTENTVAFNKWLENEWLPPLRQRYPENLPDSKIRSLNEREVIQTIHKQAEPVDEKTAALFSIYPAHLHIDLQPDLQGKGCGRSLIEILFAKLKKHNCPGVHLGVGGKNTNAIGFYKKIGFSIIEDTEWGYIMGRSLN